MPRKNPLPTFEAADTLHAELLAVLLEHRQYSQILFSVEEIHAFVEYSMLALQSCPESSRQLVLAKWGKIEPTGREDQSFELAEAKIAPVIGAGMSKSLGEVILAHVDLEWWWGECFREMFKDGRTSEGPNSKEVLVAFVQALYYVEWRRLGGQGAPRANSDVENRVHDVIVQHFSRPQAIEAWCAEQDRNMFKFTTYGAMSTVSFNRHPNAFSANWQGARVPWLLRYSKIIADLCALADELEGAGWRPEPHSFEERGKLCVWNFVDAKHPGTL